MSFLGSGFPSVRPVPQFELSRAGSRQSLAVLFLISALGGPAAASTFHVPADYPTIQEAVDAAASLDTVAVAPGTYTGTGNRQIQFFGKDVRVIGTGGAAVTILDCERAARGFDIRGGESNDALIEGFTIRNGVALALTWPGSFAAGISCRGLSHPTIRDVVIESCEAYQGGALGCADSSPIVEDCVFRGNSALIKGGAIALLNFSEPTFLRTVVTGNAAQLGGGVVLELSNATMTQCTIASNGASQAGGGIAVQRDAAPNLARVLLAANCAPNGSDLALLETTSSVHLDCSALAEAGFSPGPGSFTESGGRVLTDPLLCLPAPCAGAPDLDGDYGLAEGSPCLPEFSPCGQLIGALGQQCGEPTGVGDEAGGFQEIRASWGGIKATFSGAEPRPAPPSR